MTPQEALKKYWGFDEFRPLQADIIESVLQGRDTLALLPTGGGKSICFQVPALCQEGICIVVSPLIALMKDQVQNLQKRGILAAAIYSGLSAKDIDRILDNAAYGGYKFLYLSPERLTTELVKVRIQKMNVNLLAIDEAHCISQWGYDFRPPYLQIADLRLLIPNTPIMALTATATKEVVIDIQERLAFKEKNVFQKSFVRSNIAYVVVTENDKMRKAVDILKKVPGSGVVYVRNRKKTKDLAYLLKQNGISADFYHAGLTNDERNERQEAWIANKTRIIVSTNAFGMGIDKPDVRTVIHIDLPDNLEAYFQEAGRGGRDEKKAYAILLYNNEDRNMLEYSYQISFPDWEEVRRTYQALGNFLQLAIGSGEGESYDFDLSLFCERYKLSQLQTVSCLRLLEQAAWITLSDAVFIPSQLQILINKEQLYDYQLKNKRFENVIKAILRGYHGAFDSLIHIQERQLAEFLKISRMDLTKALNAMHSEGIIAYQPQKDMPQLTMLKGSVELSTLAFDQKLFNFRKNRFHERIQKAIAYAENAVCRSQQLIEYFGETDTTECGVCDVCLGKAKAELSADEYGNYQKKISQILSKNDLTIEQIVDTFSSIRRPMVLRCVEFMVDEGLIVRKGNLMVLSGKM